MTLGIEIKVWREGRTDPACSRLEQLEGYLTRLGTSTGWLVIFDRRQGALPIAERTTVESVASLEGRSLTLIRG